MAASGKDTKLEIMGNIVTAYLSNNKLAAGSVPGLIRSIQSALDGAPEKAAPASPRRAAGAKRGPGPRPGAARRGRPPKRLGRPPAAKAKAAATKAKAAKPAAAAKRPARKAAAAKAPPAPRPAGSPAVPISRSVTPEHLVCLEDGAKLKVLKRYLQSRFKMTPEQYKKKWGLPDDYPMVAPSYSKRRSALAKKIGLGHKGVAAKKRKRKELMKRQAG